MPRRFIDLSVSFEDRPMSPPHHQPKIEYTDHEASFDAFSRAFGGVRKEDLPEGKAWAVERVTLSTHAGTHMDAPWHYHPTTNHRNKAEGEPAATIDQVPLDYCFRPGVKLDFRAFDAGYVATPQDIDTELKRVGYALQPYDIVLVNTRAGTRHKDMDYADTACGLGRAATLHLLDQGVKVVGTDSYSWDPAFKSVAQRYKETGDPSLLWEGHKAGRELPYWQMEKLCNLELLPAFGFTVACFPVKIHRASAGWTRAVAILED
jgi:kynurenine formamidase